MKLFIRPKEVVKSTSNYYKEWLSQLQKHYPNAKIPKHYQDETRSYSEYNYSSASIVSSIKTGHFEAALQLTKKYFHDSNAIDFGCADGVFLPSLSKYYKNVFGFDIMQDFINDATLLKEKMSLNNVELCCTKGLIFEEMKASLKGKPYHIVYLLEVMEHVGDTGETMYADKRNLLVQVSNLLEKDGIIVVSVPKMVGFSYLIQRMGLIVLGLGREPISISDFLKSVFLCDASSMEKNWWHNYGHLGFNHLKLEKELAPEFTIIKKKNLLFQVVYLLKRKI
jgi:2-polyprenyl-3-methyl-5-hydroxy-6-metoxy-1,4-benzoquinol methylase